MLNFTDAQEMQRTYPATFEAPTKEELDAIKKGDIVKVNYGTERFYNKVVRVKGNTITAIVDNDLICEQLFKCGDRIVFKKCHVYSIFTTSRRKNQVYEVGA